MPVTTRYSATFDRPYDEDDRPPMAAPATRRSRSQSLQVESFTDHKSLYGFNGSQQQHQHGGNNSNNHSRSSSTEKPPKGAELIPTRNAGKSAVKPHNNPFQFVKVGTCPLYKKAEEQLKKVQEIKKPAVIKEDEEEWQSNLDSWKSRRRKMSEGTFKRQEEMRRLEMEELLQQHQQQQQQKKIKTFTEIVEERAHRGRARSLCLFSNPLESNEWIFENKRASLRMSSHDPLHASEESAESSNMNSEDDNECFQKQIDDFNNKRESPDRSEHHSNGVQTSTSNSSISKISDLSELDVSPDSVSHKDHISGNAYIDSGLESLSSSHRMGDVPDSGSDFSQDSASSISCDSPRVSGIITTGVELLEEFCSNEDLVQQSMMDAKQKSPEKLTNGSGFEESSSETQKPLTSPASEDNKLSKDSSKVKKPKPSKKTSPRKSVSKCTTDQKSETSQFNGFGNDSVECKNYESGETQREEESIKVGNADSCKHSNDLEKNASVSSSDSKLSDSEEAVSSITGSCGEGSNYTLIEEVPVDKVTEEMERLILQQLEEEELAKEMEMNAKSAVSDIDVPVKRVVPPKEKPPPPPVESMKKESTTSKSSSVKRTNSTKRILKEIHRRRSDFLGIDEPEVIDSIHDEQLAVQPPPALQDLLKAEQEEAKKFQDAVFENLASGPSSPSVSEEDEEIARKEREIIENLEKEEQMKMVQSEDNTETFASNNTSLETEEDRINRLKEERKRIEEERLLAEEQRVRMEEARLLQQREQQIKEQEANDNSGCEINDASSKNEKIPSSESSEAVTNEDKVSMLSNGGGSDALNASSSSLSSLLASDNETAILAKAKDVNPAPKPLTKKQALRKERERLRYEQEILQKEQEEHRRKLQVEQEQLEKSLAKPKHQVPGKPSICQVEPSPSISTKPLPPAQLISPPHHATTYKEAPVQVISSRAQNGYAKGPAGPHSQQKVVGNSCKQNGVPPARSRNAPDVRTKSKVPSARKQTETPAESRYNQNHWLIQEAEMRRISEQKERQRSQSQNDLRHSSLHHQNNSSHHHHHPAMYSDSYNSNPSVAAAVPQQTAQHKSVQRPSALPIAQNCANYAVPVQYSPEKAWNSVPPQGIQNRKFLSQSAQHVNYVETNQPNLIYSSSYDLSGAKVPPAKPSRGALLEKQQEQMLSVSGRKRCSHCGEELGRGAAMIIESLQLYYHIQCFKCCVCHAQLGNGSCGTDVRVRSNKLHCHNCYSNDEAGLKFSQV